MDANLQKISPGSKRTNSNTMTVQEEEKKDVQRSNKAHNVSRPLNPFNLRRQANSLNIEEGDVSNELQSSSKPRDVVRTLSETSFSSFQSDKDINSSQDSQKRQGQSFAQKCKQQKAIHEKNQHWSKGKLPKSQSSRDVSFQHRNTDSLKGSPLNLKELQSSLQQSPHLESIAERPPQDSVFQLSQQIIQQAPIQPPDKRQKMHSSNSQSDQSFVFDASPSSVDVMGLTNEFELAAWNQMSALQPNTLPQKNEKSSSRISFNRSQNRRNEPGQDSPWQKSRKSAAASYLDSLQSLEQHELISRYHEKCRVIDAGHEKIKQLEGQLHRSKLFLNMVVHDMRNPTKSIKMGLSTSISKLRNLLKIKQDHEDFKKSCQHLQYLIDINTSQKDLLQGEGPSTELKSPDLKGQVE